MKKTIRLFGFAVFVAAIVCFASCIVLFEEDEIDGVAVSTTGRWTLVNEDGEEIAGFYSFSNDGTYEMSASDSGSLAKGKFTTAGTTGGSYALTPTHINGTVLLELFGTGESLFKSKLQEKWYTAEEYATLAINFIDVEVPTLIEAETATRYAEIDADDTKTEEEKAAAKERVDSELGFKYLGEFFIAAITVAFISPTPAVNEDPDLKREVLI
jgi:hypothetical protein